MRTPTNVFSRFLGVIIGIVALAGLSAGHAADESFTNIKIKNFGQMDSRFYRGSQPKKEDFQSLAALGIKTVIDLRDDPADFEKAATEAAGMKYVNIPMSDKEYPKDEEIAAFLKLVDDPGTGAFYVHCAGGRHRTGVMGAVYRYTKYGWNFDQVYAEMKQYDFYTRFGHGDLKKYVEDYGQKIQAKTTPPAIPAVAAAK